MLKVTVDTNTFVSSLLVERGLPCRVLDAWRERRYVLATSPAIMSEIRATLQYPRIHRKYAIADEEVDQLLATLEQDALVVPGDVDVAGSVPEDADDEKVLACAVEAKADLIVTGDRHLLCLGDFRGIPILTVRELWEHLSADLA